MLTTRLQPPQILKTAYFVTHFIDKMCARNLEKMTLESDLVMKGGEL